MDNNAITETSGTPSKAEKNKPRTDLQKQQDAERARRYRAKKRETMESSIKERDLLKQRAAERARRYRAKKRETMESSIEETDLQKQQNAERSRRYRAKKRERIETTVELNEPDFNNTVEGKPEFKEIPDITEHNSKAMREFTLHFVNNRQMDNVVPGTSGTSSKAKEKKPRTDLQKQQDAERARRYRAKQRETMESSIIEETDLHHFLVKKSCFL